MVKEEFMKRRVPKGRRIFKEGEAGDFAYIVETGEVGIYKKIDGVELLIASLNPGEIFGEIAVLDGLERSASAVALQDTSLVMVEPKVLEERIAKSDKFVRTLLQVFMTNIRDTHKTYKDPRLNLKGHARSIERHLNALDELFKIEKYANEREEGQSLIAGMREKCATFKKMADLKK